MAAPLRILLADEIPSEVQDICAALRLRPGGVDVRVARDGLEAYVVARSFVPDLAIVSAHLERVDGIVLTRTLRSAPQFVGSRVVLILDGFASDRIREALEARPTSILVRPFGRDSLLQRVEDALKAPAPRRLVTAPRRE